MGKSLEEKGWQIIKCTNGRCWEVNWEAKQFGPCKKGDIGCEIENELFRKQFSSQNFFEDE